MLIESLTQRIAMILSARENKQGSVRETQVWNSLNRFCDTTDLRIRSKTLVAASHSRQNLDSRTRTLHASEESPQWIRLPQNKHLTLPDCLGRSDKLNRCMKKRLKKFVVGRRTGDEQPRWWHIQIANHDMHTIRDFVPGESYKSASLGAI